MGNFVFDQNTKDTNTGIGAGVVFKDDEKFVTIYPFNIKLFAPQFMKGEEAENFCAVYLKDFERVGCSFTVKI